MRLKGLITAMVTPFKGDEIDQEGFIHNIKTQIECGVHGILVLGTTGEAFTLNDKEKELVIRIATNEAKGKAHIMVGCGTNSTKTTLDQITTAYKLGADSALVVCPYYNCPPQEGLYSHFSYLLQNSPLPICIYNVPKRTGSNLLPETFFRLANHPNVLAIKEASGHLHQIEEILQKRDQIASQFSVLSGDDALTFPSMALGAEGVISVVSNLYPQKMSELVTACQQKNFDKARNIHFQLLPIVRFTFAETNPIPIKYAMNAYGLAAGPCRLPLCEPSQSLKEKLQKIKAHG